MSSCRNLTLAERSKDVVMDFFTAILDYSSLPCEQRFLSRKAFSAYEVIRGACESRSWFFLFSVFT